MSNNKASSGPDGERRTSMSDNLIVKMMDKLPKRAKGHIVAGAGEFVGTFMFLLFAYGALNAVQEAPKTGENSSSVLAADSSKLLFISLAFGFSLAINAWIFFRVSGSLFNPAVTLGMCLIGTISIVRGIITFIAQIAGAIAAAAVVSGLTPGGLKVRTELMDGTSVVQGVFMEMFLTAELVFTIFMLAAEKHEANFIAPIGIGLALFVAQLFGTQYTGCSVNPARSFAPDVVIGYFPGYHWIYWVGPALGAMLAAAFYKFIKALEYETVNMDKDDSLAIVGRHFDSEDGKEKLVTQDGRVIDLPNDIVSKFEERGRTQSSGESTLRERQRDGPSDIEAQQQ